MAPPNIPAAKRSGLLVDLDRLRREGDAYLTPEDRFALKTHGACAQLQPGVFMVRLRVPGGVLLAPQAHGLARLAPQFGPDWLHLTTRQNVEFHWVEDRKVPDLLHELEQIGLSSRSSCGHTMRNVLCSEDAGTSLDEPFDCFPDARLVSDTILARSAELNCVLPGRVNFTFGGSPRCRQDALVNDAGFVSVVRDGQPGYELWAGGSLGKAPALSIKLADFIARRDVTAAADALVEVFVTHGDLERPTRGRLKFVIDAMGQAAFRATWDQAFAAACARPHPAAGPVEVVDDADRVAILQRRPPGGWSIGVRPQRTPGLAMVTVDVPLGDTNGSELALYADLADRFGDGALTLTRDQNVTLRNVEIAAVSEIRRRLQPRRLCFLGEGHQASVRACTGSAVCSLGITTAPEAGLALLETSSLGRNSSLRVHISGCPNACAQHQIGDIGLSGAKVRINGRTVDGYHLYLGADLAAREVGQTVGRVAAADVAMAVDAVVGTWEALRHEGESLSATVRRIGFDAFGAQIAAELPDRWEPGADEEDEPAVDTATPVEVAPPAVA